MECANPLNEVSFIDIGTGSGVLAIQAALMGVTDIELFDYDKDSVVKADKNLSLNGISGVRASLRIFIHSRQLKNMILLLQIFFQK